MPATRIRKYLDYNGTDYFTVGHPIAYTAQETAAAAHISGKLIAKPVMVMIDEKLAMVVVPADRRVSLHRVKEVAGADHVRIATEAEFQSRFPGCEIGAMPPLGNLYGLDVLVDESLTEDPEIAFNAGNHTELIVLPYDEFVRLISPWVARVAAE